MASNPNANKLPHFTGTANSQAITFTAGAFEFSQTRYVTLSSSYVRAPTLHYPDANAGKNPRTNPTNGPQTIPAGTRVQLYSAEAAAIVAAGAGTYS
jgi:hypothetical protein